MLRRRVLARAMLFVFAFPLTGRQEKSKSKGGLADRKTKASVAVAVFAEQDKAILREYARGFGQNLPPGLAKRAGDLPPGLDKQLVRKGQLPPGLEKRIVPLPPEVEQRLPLLEPGLRRGFIAGRAVIFHHRTRVIFDVFAPLD